MGVVPDLTSRGVLPPGRTRVGADDVRARFVDHTDFSKSTTRPLIWDDWEFLTGLLRGVVDVCAAWLSGSFLTDKEDPGDLDCVFLLDARTVPTSPRGQQLLYAIAQGHTKAIRRQGRPIELDAFLLPWRPDPLIDGTGRRAYSENRGYWDDFWSRMREHGKGQPAPEDALPRRGYLEVILDGFSA